MRKSQFLPFQKVTNFQLNKLKIGIWPLHLHCRSVPTFAPNVSTRIGTLSDNSLDYLNI